MFKIFGLAGAVLVFVAVHALTADNLVAALQDAGLRPVVRRSRVSKAGFNKPQPARTASKPDQGASSAPDYKATPSYRKLLTACLGDAAMIDHESREERCSGAEFWCVI